MKKYVKKVYFLSRFDFLDDKLAGNYFAISRITPSATDRLKRRKITIEMNDHRAAITGTLNCN